MHRYRYTAAAAAVASVTLLPRPPPLCNLRLQEFSNAGEWFAAMSGMVVKSVDEMARMQRALQARALCHEPALNAA